MKTLNRKFKNYIILQYFWFSYQERRQQNRTDKPVVQMPHESKTSSRFNDSSQAQVKSKDLCIAQKTKSKFEIG